MMPVTTPVTEQIANLSPLWIVVTVVFFTALRVALARLDRPWVRAVSETCDTLNFVLILVFLLARPFVAQANYIPSASMRQTLRENDRLIVEKISYRLREPARGDVVVFNAPPQATDEGIDGINFIKRLVATPGDTVEVRAAALRFGGEEYGSSRYGLTAHDFVRSAFDLAPDVSVKFFPDHVLVGGKRRITPREIAARVGRPDGAVTIVPGRTIVNGQALDEPYTREDPDYRYGPLRLKEGQLFVMGDNRNNSRDSHVWGPLDRKRVVGRAAFLFWPLTRSGSIR